MTNDHRDLSPSSNILSNFKISYNFKITLDIFMLSIDSKCPVLIFFILGVYVKYLFLDKNHLNKNIINKI